MCVEPYQTFCRVVKIVKNQQKKRVYFYLRDQQTTIKAILHQDHAHYFFSSLKFKQIDDFYVMLFMFFSQKLIKFEKQNEANPFPVANGDYMECCLIQIEEKLFTMTQTILLPARITNLDFSLEDSSQEEAESDLE